MPILIPVGAIAIVFVAYWAYCHFVFSGASVWLGMACAVVMNLVWIYLTRWLVKAEWIAFYGVVWELGLVVLTAMYPYLVRDMRINGLFWLGIVAAVLAVVLLYMGVE